MAGEGLNRQTQVMFPDGWEPAQIATETAELTSRIQAPTLVCSETHTCSEKEVSG
jgi:hypothetical protein